MKAIVSAKRNVFEVRYGKLVVYVKKEDVSEGHLVISVARLMSGKKVGDVHGLVMSMWRQCEERGVRVYPEWSERRVLVWNTVASLMGWSMMEAVGEDSRVHKEMLEMKEVEMWEGMVVMTGQYGGKYVMLDGKKHYISSGTQKDYVKALVRDEVVEDTWRGMKVIIRKFVEVDGEEVEITTEEDKEDLAGHLDAVEEERVLHAEEIEEVIDVVEEVVSEVSEVEVASGVSEVPVVETGETFEGCVVYKRKRSEFIVVDGREVGVSTPLQRSKVSARFARLRKPLNSGVTADNVVVEVVSVVEVVAVGDEVEVDLWG